MIDTKKKNTVFATLPHRYFGQSGDIEEIHSNYKHFN